MCGEQECYYNAGGFEAGLGQGRLYADKTSEQTELCYPASLYQYSTHTNIDILIYTVKTGTVHHVYPACSVMQCIFGEIVPYAYTHLTGLD